MRINIFRNPFIDTQVGMLIDAYEDGLRKQTESYWRKVVLQEVMSEIASLQEDDHINVHDLVYVLQQRCGA